MWTCWLCCTKIEPSDRTVFDSQPLGSVSTSQAIDFISRVASSRYENREFLQISLRPRQVSTVTVEMKNSSERRWISKTRERFEIHRREWVSCHWNLPIQNYHEIIQNTAASEIWKQQSLSALKELLTCRNAQLSQNHRMSWIATKLLTRDILRMKCPCGE